MSCWQTKQQNCIACEEMLQHSAASHQAGGAAVGSSKRQRPQFSSVVPLDKDDILDDVFSCVGGGDHLYIGGVSRRRRGRYIQYCARDSSAEINGKLVTRHCNVLITESRLRLALSSGLIVQGWTFDKQTYAQAICEYSLELEKVMTLLRVHGAPWSTEMCNGAAFCNKLALLQW
jgi:hypothetical protein